MTYESRRHGGFTGGMLATLFDEPRRIDPAWVVAADEGDGIPGHAAGKWLYCAGRSESICDNSSKKENALGTCKYGDQLRRWYTTTQPYVAK
ncbi:MAG: hypothetical protein HOY44_22075 [Maritimibacter sp.]|jgi:hypothetical protein|uniref:hypothetical protein n=1 Tax=Maritimibacter sp. TaxID=2003363 RepID=UPI001D3233D0|nr:hypothetical protein [Maritimibacter sp.]MBL6430208.1 hypothetical protein [Maritimibacter sp.]